MTSARSGDLGLIFEILARFRKFPKYQLERRLDIFVALFIEEFLREYFDDSTIRLIAPELPLKCDGNRQSTNADYLFHGMRLSGSDGAARPVWILFELKTDHRSFSIKQCKRYLQAERNGMSLLLDDIKLIRGDEGSKFQEKYDHLIGKLEENAEWLIHPMKIVYLSPIEGSSQVPSAARRLAGVNEITWIPLSRFAQWEPTQASATWEAVRLLMSQIPSAPVIPETQGTIPCPIGDCDVEPTGVPRLVTHLRHAHAMEPEEAQRRANEAADA